MTNPIPARVKALALLIGDEPIAWKEREDGSIVIVFNQKGKRVFELEEQAAILPRPIMHSIHSVIHTNEEAQAVVETLTPAHTPKPKRKPKS